MHEKKDDTRTRLECTIDFVSEIDTEREREKKKKKSKLDRLLSGEIVKTLEGVANEGAVLLVRHLWRVILLMSLGDL
jgi:hypothetical protein